MKANPMKLLSQAWRVNDPKPELTLFDPGAASGDLTATAAYEGGKVTVVHGFNPFRSRKAPSQLADYNMLRSKHLEVLYVG